MFGADDAPTIVLIHGWTEGIRYWTYVIGELADEFRLVAYDLRGHGDSDPAAGGDYSLARFGDDVEAVLARSRARRSRGGGRRPFAGRDVDRRLGREPRRRGARRSPPRC